MKTGFQLSWIFILLNVTIGFAQYPGDDVARNGGRTPAPKTTIEPDTFDVQYFFQDNMGVLIPFSDTLLDNRFEQYDPARQREIDHAQLGNLGTAISPQLYLPRSHLGLDVGFHQYDLYKIHYKDIPFYKTKKPFSDLYFVQGPSQQDTYFKAKFTRNFDKGLNFSIDYKRGNNNGQFKSQAAINTALGIGFWYRSPKGKYNSFLTYVSNTNDIQDNGGIDISSITPGNSERVFNIPVFLRNANTYYLRREYAYSQRYNLVGKTDSLNVREQKLSRNFTLGHDLVFKTNKYKFFDDAPPVDSLYYDHLLVDTRGLRYFIQDNSIENTFSISTSKSGKQSQRDLLKVSLEHQIHFLNQEPRDSTINHLILGGQWNFTPSNRLKVQTFLNYNLGDNFGDYRLGGELFFDFKKVGTFKASALNQLYSPSLIQQQMFISEQELWKNDFDKTFETNLSATYSLPQLNFSATGKYHLLTNLIYFDTLAFPKQISEPVNILQFILNQNFKVSNFHLDNTVAFQTTTEDVIRVPSIFSKHSLYFEGKLFRNNAMLLRLGMDLRLVKSYYSNYYQPLIGQFHLQDSQEVELYPVVDAFATFRVQRFRFIIRTENLNQLLEDKLYFQVAGYAQPYFTVKFGVSWQLLD